MDLNLAKLVNYFYLLRLRLGELSGVLLGVLFIRLYLVAFFITNLLNWLIAGYIYRRVELDTAILHYNIDFGINLIDRKVNIFVIPLLGLVVMSINLVIVANLFKYKQERLAIHFLLSGALCTNLLLTVSLAALYVINF